MLPICNQPGCDSIQIPHSRYCTSHSNPLGGPIPLTTLPRFPVNETKSDRQHDRSLAQLYPKYHKAIPKGWDTIDVYGVHYLFVINDPSGCIQHASKKLLLSGVRTGGKTAFQDVREARDSLNRWLQLNPEPLDAQAPKQ